MSATPVTRASAAMPHAAGGFGPARFLRDAWAPLALLVVLIVGLEVGSKALGISRLILPPPSEVFRALARGFSTSFAARDGYYLHAWTTLAEALQGFVIGSALGMVLGAIAGQLPVVKRTLLPYVIALQSLPKVAIAPLFVVWFGFGPTSKVVMGVLLTFFPVLINTMAGLEGVEAERLELMKSLNASPWKTFRLVKFPSALPFIFAGLEIGAAYAVLGAVVGEFVGGQAGMGVLILQMNAALDIAGTFSALVILGVMGILISRSLRLARRRLLFWAPSTEDTLLRR